MLFSRRFGLRSLWKIVVGCPYERSSLYWEVHLSREDVFFNAASVENGIKGIIRQDVEGLPGLQSDSHV